MDSGVSPKLGRLFLQFDATDDVDFLGAWADANGRADGAACQPLWAT